MKYKDLLRQCKENPGWLASGKDKQKISNAKYVNWVESLNKEHKTIQQNVRRDK